MAEQEQIGGSGGTNMRGTGREWKERSRKAIAKKGRRGANGACERKGTDAERERERSRKKEQEEKVERRGEDVDEAIENWVGGGNKRKGREEKEEGGEKVRGKK